MATFTSTPDVEQEFTLEDSNPRGEELQDSLATDMNRTRMNFAANQDTAADVAVLKSSMDGTNVIEEYQGALGALEGGADLKELHGDLKQQRVDAVHDDLNTYLQDSLTSLDPETSAQAMAIATDLTNNANELAFEYLEDDGYELMKAEIIGAYETQGATSQKEQSRQYANRLITEHYGERGTYDAITDVAEGFIPLGFATDMAEFSSKLWGSQDEFLEATALYQTLDPVAQRMVFKEDLLPRILDAADDNLMVAQAFVESLHNPEVLGDMYVGRVFDALSIFDVTALGSLAKPWVKTAVYAAKSSGNKVRGYKNLSNEEIASTANSISALTPDAPTGMNKVEAGHSANPISTEGVSPNSVDDIADASQKSRQTVEQQLITEITDNLGQPKTRLQRRTTIKQIRLSETRANKARDVIEAAELSLKKHKASSPQGKAAKQVLNSYKQQLRAHEESIRVGKAKLDSDFVIRKTNTDKIKLETGVVPDSLKVRFDEIVAARKAKVAESLTGEGKKVADDLGAEAEKIAGSKADAAQMLDDALQGGKILDNPELYGLSTEYAQAIEAAHISGLREAVADSQKLAPGILSEKQQKAIVDSTLDRMKREAADGNSEISFGTVDMDKGGFKVKYERDGVEDSLDYEFTLNDSGVFDSVATPLSLTKSRLKGVLSPERTVGAMKDGMVRESKFAQDQAARIGNELTRSYKNIEKGLSKSDKVEVDSLLTAGDEDGVIHKLSDLLAGTVELKGVGKKAFSREVIDAYYAKRAFYDELHSFRDHLTKQQLKQLGVKEVSYLNNEGVVQKLLGTPVEPHQVPVAGNDLVFSPNNAGTGKASFIPAEQARKQAKENGAQFVKMLEGKKVGKQKVVYALVQEDDIGKVSINGLPNNVLNYSVGYLPRIYKNGYYFVKSNTDNSTLFAAESKAQADEWAEQATLESFEKGENINYSARSDREFSEIDAIAENSSGFGGLYTGGRKSDNLMLRTGDDTFQRPDRLSVRDATERYLSNLSNHIALDEYASGSVKEWENSVKSLLISEGKPELVGQVDFRKGITGLTGQAQADMDHARQYMSRVLRVPTNEEKKTHALMSALAEKMYGHPIAGGKARDLVLSHLDTNPVTALKGLTFNLHLGWFNGRQLFVQAQNAATAFAISPQHAPAALLETMGMRAAMFSDDPKVWRTVAEKSGINADEFVQSVGDFKKSGLIDGIIRQGDWDATAQGVGNNSMQLLRKGAAAGRVFFQEGELASRMISWNIAKRRLGKGATIKEISHETTRLAMDMSAANSATWQGGVLGIPTQFLQVQAKFIENIVGGLVFNKGGVGKVGWSRAEASKALVGQIALYGAAGIPIMESISAHLAEMEGVTPTQWLRDNPVLAESLEEGFVGIVTKSLGFENDFAESGSLVRGFFGGNAVTKAWMAFSEAVIDGQTEIRVTDLLGANRNTIGRTGDVFTTMYRNIHNFWRTPSIENLGYGVLESADGIISMTSTWSNAKKALLLHNLGLQSRAGTTQIGSDTFIAQNLRTLVARGIGFPTDIEQAYWDNKKFVVDYEKQKREFTEDYRQILNRFLVHGSMTRRDSELAMLGVLTGEATMKKIKKGVTKAITSGEDAMSKDLKKAFDIYMMNDGDVLLEPATATLLEAQQ